jgi:hypothetical protein
MYLRVNPRGAAYDYPAWLCRQSAAFRRLHGIKYDFVPPSHQALFDEYLAGVAE